MELIEPTFYLCALVFSMNFGKKIDWKHEKTNRNNMYDSFGCSWYIG